MRCHASGSACEDLAHDRAPLTDLDYQRLGCVWLGVLHRHQKLTVFARHYLTVVVGRLKVRRLLRVFRRNRVAGGNEAAP